MRVRDGRRGVRELERAGTELSVVLSPSAPGRGDPAPILAIGGLVLVGLIVVALILLWDMPSKGRHAARAVARDDAGP